MVTPRYYRLCNDALNLPQFLWMNSLECLLSINTMDVITTPRSYTRFLIGMSMTIKRSNSYYLSEMANSKNSSHITNYLISFLKSNRLPMMAKLIYSASIVSLTIRALSNIVTHIIKVAHGMFMSIGMMVEPLGNRSMKLPSLTPSQWLCMPMNTASSTHRDGVFSSRQPSDNILSLLPSIMPNDALIPNKFVTNLGSRYHDLALKLSNLTVTMAIPSGKTLLHSSYNKSWSMTPFATSAMVPQSPKVSHLSSLSLMPKKMDAAKPVSLLMVISHPNPNKQSTQVLLPYEAYAMSLSSPS